MPDGKMLKLLFAAIILLTLPACVSKSTFEEMAGQAKKLDTDLTTLQARHQTLVTQQNELQADRDALQARHEVLSNEKNRLEAEKTDLLAQKKALTANNKELEEILASREDSLTQKIAELRQEQTSRQTEYSGSLEEKSRQIEGQNEKISALEEDIRRKSAQIDDHEKKIAQLEKDLTASRQTTDLLNEELRLVREEKEKEVKEMSSTYQALLGKMKGEIDKGQITISELKGKLTVNMVDAILFDSGKAEVKPEGLLVLQRVIDILKEVSGKTIRIEGHTDNIQIIGLLAQKYPTNWELSAARAVNVARFLQERGIDPLHLNAVAYGEFKPVADNGTESGRAQNRRIEIVLADRD